MAGREAGQERTTSTELGDIFYDPGSAGSFGGVNRLYREAKQRGLKIKLKDVREWLSSQDTYTLHKPVIRKFKRNRVLAYHIDEVWSTDLMDVSNLSMKNDGVNFLLTIIDVFSKQVFITPLKRKDGLSVATAFDAIFVKRKPTYVYSDKGGEFFNRNVQNIFRKHNIKHYTTQNDQIKASVSERFNRSLRERLHRYLHSKNTRRYVDKLPDLVKAYEDSYHRTIKMKPNEVTVEKQPQVFNNMYGSGAESLKKGNTVRMAKKRDVFDRGYTPNWTQEEFTIRDVKGGQKIPTYTLLDLRDEPIVGTFYKQELQKIISEPNRLYKIERVLKTRRRRGDTEHLVKWLGYPDSFNSWVTGPLTDI